MIDRDQLEQPKTSWSQRCSRHLGIDRSCLFAINGRNDHCEKSARNIDRTTITTVAQLNAWDILKNRTVLVTRDGWNRFWLECSEF